MTCLAIENVSSYMSETAQGILELASKMWGKSLVCFPDYLYTVIAFWRNEEITDTQLYTVINYLIEKGYIYIQ